MLSFDGHSFDAMEIGVRSMAEWVSYVADGEDSAPVAINNSVQLYSCPVRCEGKANKTWFACGTSSSVSVAAYVHGHSISIREDHVTVDGEEHCLSEGQALVRKGVVITRCVVPVESPCGLRVICVRSPCDLRVISV